MSFVERLRAGDVVVGAWCGLAAVEAVESVASAGVDHVVIDLQHGFATESDLASLFAAIESRGAAPLVRLRSREPVGIGRVLDLGAAGIVVPNVDTAEQAAAAVAATRTAPRGTRSFGPMRAGLVRGDAWSEVAVVAQIESRAAVDAAAAIAAVDGVDGLYVGPWDLSLSLGLPVPPAFDGPVLAEALATVRAAADRAGLPAGVHTLDGASAAPLRAAGWRIVNVADDLTLLRRGAAAELARAWA